MSFLFSFYDIIASMVEFFRFYNMKKYIVLFFAFIFASSGLAFANTNFRFNESVLPYNNGLLISNYGTQEHTPKENEITGNIVYYKNKKIKSFIPAKGILNQPTAMAVYKNKLYVCNRKNIVVYNLTSKKLAGIIGFEPEVKTLNDIVLSGDELFVTATDKDCVYKINLKEKNLLPQKWLTIPSPNGIAAFDNTIYIASIPSDYKNITSENVVYSVKDKNNPVEQKLNMTPGLYDGVAVSPDGKFVYVSDWHTSSVISIDTETGVEKPVFMQSGMTPADIALNGQKLYIPDMFSHRVIVFDIKSGKTNIIQ